MAASPNPPLSDELCEAIGKHLQFTLVELIALALTGKQLQWSCYGREFVAAHHHLGQLVDEWRALEDDVAARAAAIGIALDGTATAVIERDDHRPLEPGFTEVESAIERLCSQLWDVALGVRQRAEPLGALDAVSAHVLVEVQRTLELQLWMLRTQLAN